MNTRAKLTAAEVLNSYDEKALADMFYNFGELKTPARLPPWWSSNAPLVPCTPLRN